MYSEINTLFGTMTGDSSGVYWTDAQRLAWANAAVKEAAQRTRCVEKRETILSVADTQEYSLPSDCAYVTRVAYDGERLSPIMQSHLRIEDEAWMDKSGTPFKYYLDELNGRFGLYYKPSSSTTYTVFTGEYGILLEPDSGTPESEYGVYVDPLDATDEYSSEYGDIARGISGDDIEVFYFADPADMAAGDDIPEIPQWAHTIVLFYMLARAYEADTQLQDFDKAALWQGLCDRQMYRLAVRSKGKSKKLYQMQAYSALPYEQSVKDRFEEYASET